jgi:hypothetical protein
MSPRTKLLVYGNLVIFGVVAVGSVIYVANQYRKAKEREPFQAKVDQFLIQPANELPYEYKLPKEALKIPGKIIIVDSKAKKIDPAFNDLPAGLKPANPDEVKTIVWVEYQHLDKGKYNDGTTAYQTIAKLTLIDASNNKYLWLTEVRGKLPPEKTNKTGKDFIEYPAEEIVQYLQRVQLIE